MSVRILLVDDEPNVLAAIARVLRRELGDRVVLETHQSPIEGLRRAREIEFDAVVSDYRMPGMDGLAFLAALREVQPTTARLILSGTTDFDVLMTAINETGILRFVLKPWDDSELVAAVNAAIAATASARSQAGPEIRAAAEARRLEQQEPGITKVRWGPNGEVLLDDE